MSNDEILDLLPAYMVYDVLCGKSFMIDRYANSHRDARLGSRIIEAIGTLCDSHTKQIEDLVRGVMPDTNLQWISIRELFGYLSQFLEQS